MYTVSDIMMDINRNCMANNMAEDRFSYRIIFFVNEKWCIWWDYVSEEKKCMAYDYGKKIQYRWKREQLNKYFVVQRGMPVRENEKFDLNSLIEYLQL